jgi:hypothetical protein
MAEGITGWSADGNDLRTKGYNVHDSSSWDSAPGARGQGVEIAYLDGAHFQDSAFYQSHVFNLEMLVWGRDPTTGGITLTDEWEHLADNVDAVKGFFSTTGDIDLRRTMPNGDIRQALGRVTTGIRARSDAAGALRYLTIPFTVREGSWRDITGGAAGESDATNTGLSGSGSVGIVVGGNFRTPPRITVDATTTVTDFALTFPDGATLAYTDDIPTSSSLVIDCSYAGDGRRITLDGGYADAGLQSTGRRAYWALLDSGGTNTIGYSSTTGTFNLTFEWYDRWR